MPTPEDSLAQYIQILLCVIRGDFERAAYHLRSTDASIEGFLRFTIANGLSVVVLHELKGSPWQQAHSGIELLKERVRERTARSMRLLAELQEIAATFTTAGQSFMLLKGPYLAQRFYGDPRGREYNDLDLLVPTQGRARAFLLLARAGYIRRSRALLGARLTSHFVHAFDFARDGNFVDLHWCLGRHPSFRIDESRIWKGSQAYEIDGHRYEVLADEYEIVFAILSMLRDLERQSFKIKNLIDLVRILDAVEEHFDWHSFFEMRRSEGTLGPSVNVLGVCLDVAGGRNLYPNLRSMLAHHAQRRVGGKTMLSPFVFAPAGFRLGNKLWCAQAYDTSPAKSFLWWGASLPFRLAAHRHVRRRRLGVRSASR